jgi:hypothetical protein
MDDLFMIFPHRNARPLFKYFFNRLSSTGLEPKRILKISDKYLGTRQFQK